MQVSLIHLHSLDVFVDVQDILFFDVSVLSSLVHSSFLTFFPPLLESFLTISYKYRFSQRTDHDTSALTSRHRWGLWAALLTAGTCLWTRVGGRYWCKFCSKCVRSRVGIKSAGMTRGAGVSREHPRRDPPPSCDNDWWVSWQPANAKHPIPTFKGFFVVGFGIF